MYLDAPLVLAWYSLETFCCCSGDNCCFYMQTIITLMYSWRLFTKEKNQKNFCVTVLWSSTTSNTRFQGRSVVAMALLWNISSYVINTVRITTTFKEWGDPSKNRVERSSTCWQTQATYPSYWNALNPQVRLASLYICLSCQTWGTSKY